MKTRLFIMVALMSLLWGCQKYDDSRLWNSIDGLTNRVERLEELCDRMNANISSLRTIVQALQNSDAVKSVTSMPDGEGYTITFTSGKSINIYHGKNGVDGRPGEDGTDGEDGKDGVAPVVSVKQDVDGIYYWIIDGEWLIVDGHKVKAVGTDGEDGSDGADGEDGRPGTDGTDGRDAITPQFKIEDGYWYISYDNKQSWEQLGKATGDDGMDANYIIKDVYQDERFVYFVLADDETISIAKQNYSNGDYIIFDDINVKMILMKHIDVNRDGQISYEEAASVKSLGEIFKDNENIKLFHELKYFTGLTGIEKSVFEGCKSLFAVTIPANVVAIGESAFEGCSNLYAVVFTENSKLEHIGKRAFAETGLWDVNWPNTLKQIGEEAFYMADFESINLPNSLISIGAGAFAYNRNLQMLTFEEDSKLVSITGGTFVGNDDGMSKLGAFSYCEKLEKIILSASVQIIGDGAFYNCISLKKVSFEENSMLTNVGMRAFGKEYKTGDEAIVFDASNCTKPWYLSTYVFHNLDSFICVNENPPQISSVAFYHCFWEFNGTTQGGVTSFKTSSLLSKMKLYVPANSIEKYRNADYWKEIGTILPIEEYKEEN